MDSTRDHVRGGTAARGVVTVVVYGDYLCPYCRRLRFVIARLREALGERLAYVFRHYPNETAHPGATFIARVAEAAANQGHFWEMHDWLYESEPPLAEPDIRDFVASLGLDMESFDRDLNSDQTRERVESDLDDGRRNGVTGTPSFFIDGVCYEGAWDFHSMLEALQLPVAARLGRSARAFANLPAAGGLVLLLAAALALALANSPLGTVYETVMSTPLGIGPLPHPVSLSVAAWFSEGLLAIFFLLVGLEIRREMTTGELSNPRAAILPVVAALGGVLAPAGIYLLLNADTVPEGWAVPTATDIAFTLGILALLGSRVPASLRVFVATLAVADDVISVLTLAVFYPKDFEPTWLSGTMIAVLVLFALNRWRVYSVWPYLLAATILWVTLHETGVHGALAGIILACFLPTRPAPVVGPLLAQAATALSTLEQAESEARLAGEDPGDVNQELVWEWASRNLSAASERLLSPAERIERAVEPWSTYLILPLFAFSATGVRFDFDLSTPQHVIAGILLDLVIGKPLGICLASLAAIKMRFAVGPADVSARQFLGATCLCGVGYTVALLMADEAFTDPVTAELAKASVLIGSTMAIVLGAGILGTGRSDVGYTVGQK
ncbi:MAG: Na+/H+ antiporter NhaA [Salaquimonas sp.]|nr:Na+/H+ antiporter NhaA [Salaquimonas sp.]